MKTRAHFQCRVDLKTRAYLQIRGDLKTRASKWVLEMWSDILLECQTTSETIVIASDFQVRADLKTRRFDRNNTRKCPDSLCN